MRADWFHTELVFNLPRLRRFAFSLCGDKARADDILQGAVEKALARRGQLVRRKRIRGWLMQIVYREFIDETRRQSRYVAMPEGNVIPLVRPVPARQETISECRSALEAMRCLPEDQRAALSLIAIEGLGYDEAARILKINSGTLRSRLARARQFLREATEASAEGATIQPRKTR